jgi:hypothetical protein
LEGQSFEEMSKIVDTSYDDAKHWSNKGFEDWSVIFPSEDGTDGAGGTPYWWNSATDQSSYTAPTAALLEHAQWQQQQQQQEEEEQEEQEEQEEEEGPKSMVAYPWSIEYDDVGAVYYYNAITMESQWNRPMDEEYMDEQEELQEEEEALQVDIVLGDDWESCADGDGGVYYFSESRQESTWNDPRLVW